MMLESSVVVVDVVDVVVSVWVIGMQWGFC